MNGCSDKSRGVIAATGRILMMIGGDGGRDESKRHRRMSVIGGKPTRWVDRWPMGRARRGDF